MTINSFGSKADVDLRLNSIRTNVPEPGSLALVGLDHFFACLPALELGISELVLQGLECFCFKSSSGLLAFLQGGLGFS